MSDTASGDDSIGPNTVDGTKTRRIVMAATMLVAFCVVGVAAWSVTGAFVDNRVGRQPPTSFFADNRADFERVLSLVRSGDLIVDGYYGPELPDGLQHLSVTDRVSIYPDGSFFVPRWTGIPDDAGGIWWSPTSPESRDMYGMACVEPTDLIGNWWRCGERLGLPSNSVTAKVPRIEA